MFQLIGTPQGIEQVTLQSKDTLTKVYAIGARLFLLGLGAPPRSASKLSIDPIKRHASYFRKCTGSNKRTVPNNRTVCCNWNQRVGVVYIYPGDLGLLLQCCIAANFSLEPIPFGLDDAFRIFQDLQTANTARLEKCSTATKAMSLYGSDQKCWQHS